MSILSLPAEIQVLTLSFLSFRDILHCKSLSKHFHALIDSSVELSHLSEFGIAGVKDNPLCPDSLKVKVGKLWRSNIAWANLHWLCRREIALCGTGRLFDISDGLFFHSTDDGDANHTKATSIEWFKLPSRRDPNPGYVPQKLAFDAPLSEFAVDSARDLIIGIELTSFRNNRYYTIMCNLYPRTISTNEFHPSAAQPAISYRFVSPITDFEATAQISGNHIGVLLPRKFGVTNPESFDMFLLLDWTSGVFKANMSTYGMEEFWESFCFLTTDSVLIPSAFNSLLNVYYFDNTADSLRHEVSLLLPDPLTRDGLRHIYLHSQPSPSTTRFSSHPTGDIPPFHADPDGAVIILSLDYKYHAHGLPEDVDEGHNAPQVVAVPRRVLTRFSLLARSKSPELSSMTEGFHARAYPAGSRSSEKLGAGCMHERVYAHTQRDLRKKRSPHLHAEQWIHSTRWGIDSVTPSMGCFAHGSRYLGMSSRVTLSDAPASAIALYDFNVRNEQRGCGYLLDEENVRRADVKEDLSNEDEDWDYDEETGERRWPVYPSTVVTTPSFVMLPEVFKRPFSTALPYRVTETEMVLPWDSAIIDGERIIGLEFVDYNSGSIEKLDVIVI